MGRLLIVGAGGFGREVWAWARAVAPAEGRWETIAFLDRNPDALGGKLPGADVVGDPEQYLPCRDDVFVCAVGDPWTKLKLCRLLEVRGGRFVTLCHPSVIVGPGCLIGKGCILCPGVVLTTNVRVGDFVTVNLNATIGHDATIGDGCTLSAQVDVTGFVSLGEGVLVGSHATLLPSVNVGNYAVVGAGSVVSRNVPPQTTVFGLPARKICVKKKK